MASKGGSAGTRGTKAVDKHIGARVRARRVAVGMSQAELGAAIGVTFQQVQKYELGVNRIAASTLFSLAQALDTSFTSLLPSGLDEGQAPPDLPLSNPALIKLNELFPKLSEQASVTLLGIARLLIAQDGRKR